MLKSSVIHKKKLAIPFSSNARNTSLGVAFQKLKKILVGSQNRFTPPSFLEYVTIIHEAWKKVSRDGSHRNYFGESLETSAAPSHSRGFLSRFLNSYGLAYGFFFIFLVAFFVSFLYILIKQIENNKKCIEKSIPAYGF